MSQPTLDYATPSAPARAAAAVFSRQTLPLLATVLVCGLIYGYAAINYQNFTDVQNFLSFFGRTAAFWGVTAVGMTFVILAGGIDLSVGSVIALSTVLIAVLIQRAGFSPWIAIPVVLVIGTAFGAGQGCLIHFFTVPPFLITLGGLFLARGLALVIQPQSLQITHRLYTDFLSGAAVPLGHDLTGRPIRMPIQGVVFLLVLAAGFVVARFTRFGRTTYAVGGSEQSAVLMGLPVGPTKIGVYAISGFCAALGGLIYTFDSSAGNANYAVGKELDVIAAVVVGGTVLTGGSGSMIGTLFGFLTFSILQTAIYFNGHIEAAWNRIAVGVLLLAFILLQKAVGRQRKA